MAKEYNLHSVRIEDEVWRQVKESGISVNQLLQRALLVLGPTWVHRIAAGPAAGNVIGTTTSGLSSLDAVSPEPSLLRGKATIETHRAPLLKPSEKKR